MGNGIGARAHRIGAGRAIMAVLLRTLVGATLAVSLFAAQTPSVAPVQTPTDVKPGSINCEECPYPYRSSYLPLKLYGHDVRIAYMDVTPAGTPNGHAVVL